MGFAANKRLTLHLIEKIGVVFRRFDFVLQEFHRFHVVHRMQEFAQQPHALQLVVWYQQFFAACA